MMDWSKITPKEMLSHSRKRRKGMQFHPNDLAVKVGLLLLMPYVFWLSKYSDSYVETVHNKPIHFNLDGVLLSFHNLINGANMIVHEAGHGVCYILSCPPFMTFLNGTLFQLLLPVIFVWYYKKHKQVLGVGLGLMWLAQNLIYVAWYMSYAQTPNKYPFFLGGAATHDFWYMFSHLGVLEYDWLIAGIVRAVAVVLLLGSYMYLLYITFLKNNKPAKKVKYE